MFSGGGVALGGALRFPLYYKQKNILPVHDRSTWTVSYRWSQHLLRQPPQCGKMDESHCKANPKKSDKLNILEGHDEDSQVSWRTGAVGAPPERKVISNCSATTLAACLASRSSSTQQL